MDVREDDSQTTDAMIETAGDGTVTVVVRRGLLPPRAFTALVVALAPVVAAVASEVAQGQQYLQHAG